jgi:hypothetical protein
MFCGGDDLLIQPQDRARQKRRPHPGHGLADQHAVGVAPSGDTIMIAPGAYNQYLPKIISEARAGHINVAVTGSD